MRRKSGKQGVPMSTSAVSPTVPDPVLNLPQLSKEEMERWWKELGGDEAFEANERAIEESLLVSEDLLSSMVR